MIRRTLFLMTAALLLATGVASTALGAPTAEQKCQQARAQAWGKYQACVENVAGKVYAGTAPDPFNQPGKLEESLERRGK